MTNQELRRSVVFINRIIASNNPKDAVTELKRRGYETQYDILPADQIEKALLELYVASPSGYVSAIRGISYREDITNWTTSPQTKEQIREIARQFGIESSAAKFDLSGIWQGIKDGIGTTITQMGGGGTTVTESLIPIWLTLLVVVAGILAILFILKKYGKTTA